MIRFKPFRRIAMGLLLMAFCHSAMADRDGENAALSRVVHELDALIPLINAAKAQADADNRVQFDYASLMIDVERIKSAVQEHILAPRTQPRRFAPLTGDYRH